MELEMRFFATFREAVGQKTISREFDGETMRAEEVLRQLETEFPAIDVFEDEGTLRGSIIVLKNGREVTHGDGVDTTLADGDTLSVFPPVAGG